MHWLDWRSRECVGQVGGAVRRGAAAVRADESPTGRRLERGAEARPAPPAKCREWLAAGCPLAAHWLAASPRCESLLCLRDAVVGRPARALSCHLAGPALPALLGPAGRALTQRVATAGKGFCFIFPGLQIYFCPAGLGRAGQVALLVPPHCPFVVTAFRPAAATAALA